VLRDSVPLEGAIVRTIGATVRAAQTDTHGLAILAVPAGEQTLVASQIGHRPDTLRFVLRAGQDTAVVAHLEEQHAELEAVIVSATRGERRVEDTPLRVEVIDEDEVAEKVAMTPGDIAMMLNETSGLRVQTTNPSLGGANVRIQGLQGRYSLILADGLPLYGGQAGGLGLLQIPPVDLGRVEIIKGTASALYGSSALGGVINLLSRRPTEKRETTLLVNQTSRGGTDGVAFLGGPTTERWGYTLLAGGHRQQQNDLDGDGWTDMPGYRRVVVRPRLYFDDRAGRTAFLTGGMTAEDRNGGTINGRSVPDGEAFPEALRTRRADLGGLARWVIADSGTLGGVRALHGSILTIRGSAVEQRHGHRFGVVRENDRHRTWFGEAALAIPRGRATYIAGAAYQQDGYRNVDVPGFDYVYSAPAAFVQADVDPMSWISLSASARLDAHSEYGAFINPRLSVLLRRPSDGALAGWTSRLSGGTGAFAPAPFTEETETTGLTPVAPLSGLIAERARSVSMDVNGPLQTPLGPLELNATAFGSRIAGPVQVYDISGVTTDGARRIALANAPGPTRTWGGELLARLVHELGADGGEADEGETSLRITGTYTYLRSTECDPDAGSGSSAGAGVGCTRREVPLTPRHAIGVVTTVEQEGRSRVGLELYFTGKQALEDDPYRAESRPYLIVGLMGEQAFETRGGIARVFLNLENLTNVRQTRFDPLLLPARGRGGRWATDAWTELTGFTMNAGVRLGF